MFDKLTAQSYTFFRTYASISSKKMAEGKNYDKIRIRKRDCHAVSFSENRSKRPCSLLADCAAGANICASAALGANLRVNRIVLALGDSTHRAFINASTASDTFVRNYVSHSF